METWITRQRWPRLPWKSLATSSWDYYSEYTYLKASAQTLEAMRKMKDEIEREITEAEKREKEEKPKPAPSPPTPTGVSTGTTATGTGP